jgi:acyl dehydratase
MVEKTLAEGEMGEKFEGGSKTITEEDLDSFCQMADLGLEVFLKDEAAMAMGFKRRVVPGGFLFSLVFGLLGDLLDGHIHVGTEKLKVIAPVHPDDTVKVDVDIVDKKTSSKGDKVFVTWGWTLRNQDDVVVIQGENT